jgi:hypothetical protein
VARIFLEAWFAIWKDGLGQRRTPDDAEQRYRILQTDAEAAKLAPLRRQQQHLDLHHFVRLSAFLRNPAWESTNNAAERGGRRAFRHDQHPHFRLRSARAIDADLKLRAYLQRGRFCSLSVLATPSLSARSPPDPFLAPSGDHLSSQR